MPRVGGARVLPASGSNDICCFWLQGRCNRDPCRFVHGEETSPYTRHKLTKQSHAMPYARPKRVANNGSRNSLVSSTTICATEEKSVKDTSTYSSKCQNGVASKKTLTLQTRNGGSVGGVVRKIRRCHTDVDVQEHIHVSEKTVVLTPKVSASDAELVKESPKGDVEAVNQKRLNVRRNFQEDCSKGSLISVREFAHEDGNRDKPHNKAHNGRKLENGAEYCGLSQPLFQGDSFSMLANLTGHNEAISGVALPSGSDKLYSGSSDGTIRQWDCYTGQSVGMVNLGDKVGSVISEGPWLFFGIPNAVKALNIERGVDFHLSGPVGQVYSIVVALDMLLAGVQDGSIVTWKGSTENPEPFQLSASLKGHTGAVTSLVVGAMKLYSSSVDSTIRVWDLLSLQCVYTINGHKDSAMSLVCWSQYILSCSLDRTIKVWSVTEKGDLEIAHTLEEDHGALTLCGVMDAEAKPILLCSFEDKSVHLYDLPSFKKRGTIWSKQEVRSIGSGPGGLFFTGDGTGTVTVWKLKEPTQQARLIQP